MSERSIQLWLQDILEATGHIIDFTTNFNFEKFATNLQLKHAVLHNFAIIGEAAGKIPLEYKEAHPDIAWREIKGSAIMLYMSISDLMIVLFGILYKMIYLIYMKQSIYC